MSLKTLSINDVNHNNDASQSLRLLGAGYHVNRAERHNAEEKNMTAQLHITLNPGKTLQLLSEDRCSAFTKLLQTASSAF